MNRQDIILRKFPYPYRAALALCSDVDNTDSADVYFGIMDYLNSNKSTKYGVGLGLETGNSIWFFNNTENKQLSYFDDLSGCRSDFAVQADELIKSRHIDVMHTYGNFDEGGFKRKYADTVINELTKNSYQIDTWTNHGNDSNTQNLGWKDCYKGSDPAAEQYHFGELYKYGIKYVWQGKMTHILGQNAKNSFGVMAKNTLQKALSNTKYRRVKKNLFDNKNRLMTEKTLQDGNRVWDFVRFVNSWGKETTLDIHDLSGQLSRKNINKLIDNEGFLIVYTHIGEGVHDELPLKLKECFQYIAQKSDDKTILVTTTSRLLRYYENTVKLSYSVNKNNGVTEIIVSPELETLQNKYYLKKENLQGLTFYCSEPDKTKILLGSDELEIVSNQTDHTGRRSVSVPWIKLEYPR